MSAISMYAASVPVFDRMLNNLSAILDKAMAHCAARKIEPQVLLNMRLSPDMFTLTRQVQIACDFAKGTAARLAGVEVPKYDDDESTFADLKARIAKTQAFIRTLSTGQIDGSETREISITIAGTPTTFKGLPYLLHFALPNFYFHATTAYGILRHAGVELGKRDFIGGTN
ncbi:MAG TPA: DUF1993 domain-containing protein [Burkholderiaceae bacterium]|nr:DUF1993 domain-containing protein [Burkholderiaceae bacterium]